MYTSSKGEYKDPKDMNTEYIINATSKAYRDIFTTEDMEVLNRHLTNIIVLRKELESRVSIYLQNVLDKKESTNV